MGTENCHPLLTRREAWSQRADGGNVKSVQNCWEELAIRLLHRWWTFSPGCAAGTLAAASPALPVSLSCIRPQVSCLPILCPPIARNGRRLSRSSYAPGRSTATSHQWNGRGRRDHTGLPPSPHACLGGSAVQSIISDGSSSVLRI